MKTAALAGVAAICVCVLVTVSQCRAQQAEDGVEVTASRSAAPQQDYGTPPAYRCPEVCTAQFDPVCARRGRERRTFGNRCELKRENCQKHTNWVFQHDGECR